MIGGALRQDVNRLQRMAPAALLQRGYGRLNRVLSVRRESDCGEHDAQGFRRRCGFTPPGVSIMKRNHGNFRKLAERGILRHKSEERRVGEKCVSTVRYRG